MIFSAKKTIRLVTISSIGLVLLGVYYHFDPTSSGWIFKCPFHMLTGLDCPACGNQRALHCILHMQWAKAWGYNPFLFVSLPYLILLAVSALFKERLKVLWSAISNRKVVIIYAVAICIWWIVRNLI